MKKVIIKSILILLIILEGTFLILPNNKFINKVEKVSYENNNIDTKKAISYLIGDENGGYTEATDRTTWPNKNEYKYIKSICYDGDGNEIKASEVITFDNSENKTMVNTATTLYCYMYFLPTSLMISPSKLTGAKLETSDEANARNSLDDLRRFIGTYEEVKDNFICFGTIDKEECKNNMDLYMYRIIGVDTEGRLKIIKATTLVQGSSVASFPWNYNINSDVTWPDADLYKRLNGTSSSNIFIGNEKYSYMQDTAWTDLISPITYYIGDSNLKSNPTLFNNERSNSLTNGGKIGLMYASDYLYADSNDRNGEVGYYENWLTISHGLNGATNTPSGTINPNRGYEWTMIRYGPLDGPQPLEFVLRVWFVQGDGFVGTSSEYYYSAYVRPVFFLEPNVMLYTGMFPYNMEDIGTIDNPYIIYD